MWVGPPWRQNRTWWTWHRVGGAAQPGKTQPPSRAATAVVWAGVALMPFVVPLGMVVRAGAAPAGLIVTLIVLNFAWVAASLWVAFGPVFAPTLIGKVFIVAQAAMVALFADLQIIGLRRTNAMA